MPTNVTAEYGKARGEYAKAKTKQEKIEALEDMIRALPKHKGTDHLFAELKGKLAKLKAKTSVKTGSRTATISKEGDAQVCIIGKTNTGKSTLLSKLTNAKVKISITPYTTEKPQIGVMDYKGVKIQLVEIPSKFTRQDMSIAQGADAIIVLGEMNEILKKYRIRKPIVKFKNIETIRDELWSILGLIKIYTKEPGKAPETKALVLKKGSNVKHAATKVHKDFVKFFKFARIWGASIEFQGTEVGMKHVLADDDIVEIHME